MPTLSRDLLVELVRRAVLLDLRILLLNYTFDLPAEVEPYLLREEIAPIERADIETFIFQQFQSNNRPISAETVATIADQVMAATEQATTAAPLEGTTQPYPSANRLRILNRAISAIVQATDDQSV